MKRQPTSKQIKMLTIRHECPQISKPSNLQKTTNHPIPHHTRVSVNTDRLKTTFKNPTFGHRVTHSTSLRSPTRRNGSGWDESSPLSRPEDHRSRETIFSLLHSPVSTRQRRVRDREPSSKLTGDRILAASADYYAERPPPLVHGGKKETRGTVGGQLFRPLSTIQRAYTARNTS